jgi:murein L,D-transpeptidase YafK
VRRWIGCGVVVVGILLLGLSCTTTARVPESGHGCMGVVGGGAYVAVHHSAHELLLCDGGNVVRRFDVRLAKNGMGKSREGDGKVPLGAYPLAGGVVSSRFGKFLLIGYPTTTQRAQGMTGSAVGVHGPAREVRFLGSLINTFDTTDGCVGLAHDHEVAAIDQFVRARNAHTIVID